jgi:L-fuconolactonase
MRLENRRRFLKASAAAIAGAVAGESWLSQAAGAEEPAKMEIVDTHTHFYDPTRPQGVPWPAKDDKLLYRRVLPEDYRQLTKPHGVTGTVVVEASPWVEDNQWVLSLAAKNPIIVGVVGRLTPGTDDFRKHLERFSKNSRFRGLRLGVGELKKGLGEDRFVKDLKLLTEDDLELDAIGGPDLLPEVVRLAGLLPDLRVVINHVSGVPIDGKAPPRAWLDGVREAAKRRQVYCKVSGLAEATGKSNGDAPKDVAFYKPVLDALWEAFGEDRLIYGSNWPVSERFATYGTVQAVVSDYFRGKGKTAVAKFFAGNAKAAYKW